MNTSIEKDIIARNRIVSDTDSSFFVEAGAGSGKTTMLVRRMVAMVEQGKDISRICAITFTKAAANEFYERFQKLLIERSSASYVWEDTGRAGQLPKPTPETMANCRKALENIDLCFMGTIDAFCGRILSEHPSEAHVPSDSVIIDDPERLTLYQQIFVSISRGDFGGELKKDAQAFRFVNRDAEEAFAMSMKLLMDNRNVTFHYTPQESFDIKEKYGARIKALVAGLRLVNQDHSLLLTGTKDCDKALEKLPDSLRTLERNWSYSFSNLYWAVKNIVGLRLKPEAYARYGVTFGEICEKNPGKRSNYYDFVDLRKEGGLHEELMSLQYSVSMTFLHKCIPCIEGIMREKGCLSYFDYLYYLRNMLREDAGKEGKLIRYINNRHSYYLIDEFQDTNPMQAEVFFYLASENPVVQWNENIPKPGSLFIVGDPKQSIYRFRGADVSSFLKVKNLFEGNIGDVLFLCRNFRSTRTMCKYFNRVFKELLPEETELQSRFEEIPVPENNTEDFEGIYSYKMVEGAVADYPDKQNNGQISRIITTLVNNPAYRIKDGSDMQPRPITYKDFMVITSAKASLGPIIDELDRLGIPTKVEGKVLFETNEALRAVCRIYSAVALPGDKRQLYGALTSGVAGLSEDVILRLQKEACKLTPAALYSRIMEDFRIYTHVSSENMEILYYALELLRSVQRAGLVVTLQDGAAYLNQLLAAASGEERCLSLSDEKDAVHMANLHKVKGLEAPIVILSAAKKRVKYRVDKRIVHGKGDPDGYIFAMEKEDDSFSSYFSTSEYKDEKELEKECAKAEEDRLIYVAATRARNALIICDNQSVTKEGWLKRNTKWEPLLEAATPDIFKSLAENRSITTTEADTVKASELYKEGEETAVLADRTLEEASFEVRLPSMEKTKSKLSEDTSDEDSSTKPDMKSRGVHQFPDLLGTMVHKLMEMLVVTENRLPAETAVPEIVSEFLTERSEAYRDEFAKALNQVAETMRSGGFVQENGAEKDLLAVLMKAAEVHCEVPFSYKEETGERYTLWTGVMDLVYLDEKGWHIVDYKTNLDGNDLDSKYEKQLEAYVKAFKAITGEDAVAKIYHVEV